MNRASSAVLILSAAIVLSVGIADVTNLAQSSKFLSFAFVNGNWFNDTSFDAHTLYSIDGRLTFRSRRMRIELWILRALMLFLPSRNLTTTTLA